MISQSSSTSIVLSTNGGAGGGSEGSKTSSSAASSLASASASADPTESYSTGITFKLGPFNKKYIKEGRISEDPKPASKKPCTCTFRSHNRFLFSNPDNSTAYSQDTYSGVRYDFSKTGVSVLEVFIIPNYEKKRSAGYKNEQQKHAFSTTDYNSFNFRITTSSSYLASDFHQGISIVTKAIVVESRNFSKYVGTYLPSYEYGEDNTDFDLSKPFHILRLETGDFAIRNSEGEWSEYIMKEERYRPSITLAFQGCNIIVEAMDVHSKSVEDIIAKGTAHITRIRTSEKAESERLAPLEAATIAEWTAKKAADDKAEAEATAKAIAEAKAKATTAAKLLEERLKLYSIITKYILPVLREKIAKKKAAEDKKAREDLERALKEQEEEW